LYLVVYGAVSYVDTVQVGVGFVGGFDFLEDPYPVDFPVSYVPMIIADRDM